MIDLNKDIYAWLNSFENDIEIAEDTKSLYDTAKAFIKKIRECLEKKK